MNLTHVASKALFSSRFGVRRRIAVVVLGAIGWSLMPTLFPSAGVVYAQNTNATIRGQVLDPTGALVPNAKVVILNERTGVVVFNGVSDSAGAFVAPQVIPGTYRITVTAEGLKQAVINDLVATVAQVASVNVTMEIGGATEVVTVQSNGQELDRSTSTISTLISPQDVQNLPLQQRDYRELIGVHPWSSAWWRWRSTIDLATLDQRQPYVEHRSAA